MLRELRVRNYALIEELELVLPEGLVIFTGETGAGKSIIIGALALALGGRTQAEQIRAGTDEIVVEARFGGPFDPAVEETLREAGLSAAGYEYVLEIRDAAWTVVEQKMTWIS